MFKKFLKSYFLYHKSNSGFTLIELVIVFSILAIVSTVGIAAFVNYTNSQKLRNTTLDIKTLLQQARSQSSSQINTCANGTAFQGYVVQVCCATGAAKCFADCAIGNDVELDILCSGTYTTVQNSGRQLPSGVTIDSVGTTNGSYQFIPITGGVMQSGAIVLDGTSNSKQTITVTNAGIIQ